MSTRGIPKGPSSMTETWNRFEMVFHFACQNQTQRWLDSRSCPIQNSLQEMSKSKATFHCNPLRDILQNSVSTHPDSSLRTPNPGPLAATKYNIRQLCWGVVTIFIWLQVTKENIAQLIHGRTLSSRREQSKVLYNHNKKWKATNTQCKPQSHS